MRKRETVSAAAERASQLAGGRGDAPTELVCLALALSLLVLVARIASIW
jgi:hypothetical protein